MTEGKRSQSNWIFLRGWAREAGHWLDFPDRFSQRFGVRVRTLDLPGAGEYRHQSSPIQISDYVDFLRSRVGPSERLCLFAVSLGGMVALDWLNRFPAEVERAVVINSSLRRLSPFYRRLRPGNYRSVLRIAGHRDAGEFERSVLQLVSSQRPISDSAWRRWTQIHNERPMKATNMLRQLLAASRYRGPDKLESANILWLRSLGDQLVNSTCTEDLHRFYGGVLATHESGGHDLTLDAPDWVLDQVDRWLSRIPPQVK